MDFSYDTVFQCFHHIKFASWKTVEIISRFEFYCQNLALVYDNSSTSDFLDLVRVGHGEYTNNK